MLPGLVGLDIGQKQETLESTKLENLNKKIVNELKMAEEAGVEEMYYLIRVFGEAGATAIVDILKAKLRLKIGAAKKITGDIAKPDTSWRTNKDGKLKTGYRRPQ